MVDLRGIEPLSGQGNARDWLQALSCLIFICLIKAGRKSDRCSDRKLGQIWIRQICCVLQCYTRDLTSRHRETDGRRANLGNSHWKWWHAKHVFHSWEDVCIYLVHRYFYEARCRFGLINEHFNLPSIPGRPRTISKVCPRYQLALAVRRLRLLATFL